MRISSDDLFLMLLVSLENVLGRWDCVMRVPLDSLLFLFLLTTNRSTRIATISRRRKASAPMTPPATEPVTEPTASGGLPLPPTIMVDKVTVFEVIIETVLVGVIATDSASLTVSEVAPAAAVCPELEGDKFVAVEAFVSTVEAWGTSTRFTQQCGRLSKYLSGLLQSVRTRLLVLEVITL